MVTYQAKQHIIYALIGATGGLMVQLLCILYIKTYPKLLNESTERINFVLCMITMFLVLSILNHSSFLILMPKLFEVICNLNSSLTE